MSPLSDLNSINSSSPDTQRQSGGAKMVHIEREEERRMGKVGESGEGERLWREIGVSMDIRNMKI
jgi:hypothetical protein